MISGNWKWFAGPVIVIVFSFIFILFVYFRNEKHGGVLNLINEVEQNTDNIRQVGTENFKSGMSVKKESGNDLNIALISVMAGKKTIGFTDGKLNYALFGGVYGIAFAKNGDIYLADAGNNAIRKIMACGIVVTVSGDINVLKNDHMGKDALNSPLGLAVDKKGNVFIAEYGGHRIIKINDKGRFVVFAGSGMNGLKDGWGIEAEFCNPRCVAIDDKDNLYVADEYNNSIRKITPGGLVSTLAGSKSPGYADGISSMAAFNRPYSIACGRDGNIYVADFMNDKIRKISAYGNVSTMELKHRDLDKKYRLKSPCSLAFDDKQNLYVSDLSEHRLKKIGNDGYITAVNLKSDGAGENIVFSGDISIAVNSNGEMIVSDSKLPQIRKVVFKSR